MQVKVTNSKFFSYKSGKQRLVMSLLGLILLTAGSLVAQENPEETAPIPDANDTAYILDAGDRVKISVFNQDDLSGEYTLDGQGRFSMPLIGMVEAAGRTPAELEELLVSKFKPDYLVNPRIFIQVMNYRPYYLMGEVNSTGAFQYVSGITYLTAIAIAGGFTYRAKQNYVYVIRADDPSKEEVKLDINEKVQPGDIIRVAERLF